MIFDFAVNCWYNNNIVEHLHYYDYNIIQENNDVTLIAYAYICWNIDIFYWNSLFSYMKNQGKIKFFYFVERIKFNFLSK